MKISVAIITYNHQAYIAEAVNSALSQKTSHEIEVRVADDCSTDGTGEILEGLAKEHPARLNVVRHRTNVGMHANFFGNIAACRGEYIALLDGDDVWTSADKLERQARALDENPSCSMCFHATRVIDDRGRPIGWLPETPPAAITTMETLSLGNRFATASVMFRRTPGPLPAWMMTVTPPDWALHLYNASLGDAMFLDDDMASYRVHHEGVWSSRPSVERLQSEVELLQQARVYFRPRFDESFRLSLACRHFELAKQYFHLGQRRRAREHASAALLMPAVQRPFRRRSALELLALSYLPGAQHFMGRRFSS